MSDKIEILMNIVTELDARDCSNNCICDSLMSYSWTELCDFAIELLKEIR